VKYFSGTATYSKTIDVPADWFRPGADLMLDLGEVRELAEVSVNDTSFESLWNPPFGVDVTSALHPGKNVLRVKVTNLWVNRLIGDQQPDAGKKYTFSLVPTYNRNASLRPSGLLDRSLSFAEARQAKSTGRNPDDLLVDRTLSIGS